MERRRDCGGQATTEYVALVALVAVALALASGLTSGGVGRQVLAGLQRGLCHVAPVGCPRPEPPRADLAACPLERSVRGERLEATIAVLRLGTTGSLSITRTSDGRVAVALAEGGSAAGAGGLGVRLRLGRRALGGELRASAGASWTSGRAWRFPNEAAARRFVATYGRKATIGGQLLDRVRSRCSILCDALAWRPHAQLPEPDETFSEAGPATSLTAALGLARAVLQGDRLLGRRIARDGSRTWYLRPGVAASAALDLPGGELIAGAGREAVLAYEVDARGHPRALRVTRVGELRGGASAAQRLGVGHASLAAGGGGVVELEATLDLREPTARAAARELLDALGGEGDFAALAGGARQIGRQIARRAWIDRRTYVAARTATGLGAGAGLGVALDAGLERSAEGLRLAGAETRLPGLPFLPRDDCRPGAPGSRRGPG